MAKKRYISNRISLLLLSVMTLLMLLDIFTDFFLKNITNLQKILIYGIIFIMPIWIYIKKCDYKRKSALKLNHVKIKYLPFIIFFALTVSIVCAMINMLTGAVFQGIFDIKISTSTVPFSSENPFVILLTAIILPAVCEELLIRGIALTEYERYGVPLSIILTSVIFALFHGSLFSLISLFIAGVCYAILTHLFKSVWPAIICHMINNSLAVYINYNADYIRYLCDDFLFVMMIIAAIFVIIIVTLKLSEPIVDLFTDKKRFKTNTREMAYGEPLGSIFIWIFIAISIFNIVRNVL